jgi:hypothetical protein
MPSHSLQIASRPGQTGPSKHQQRFNTLIKKVAQLKQALQSWTRELPGIFRLTAECRQRTLEHRAALSELVRLLDRLSTERSLTKRERTQLRQWICETAVDLLQDGGAEDLKAIYNKHSRGDYDAEAATQSAMQADAIKEILQDGFGMDFGNAQFSSLEDLQQAAAEKLDAADREAEQRHQAAEARKAKRKKSARQIASDERRDSRTAQIGKTLQEIYRKLALLLHPDHERDPAERARKTQLMQEVNIAYERKDLLGLLELQLRFEQVDAAHINSIAEDRLIHFNSLLAEQVRQLQQELAGVEEPWRAGLDSPPNAKLTPAKLQAALHRDLRGLATELAAIQRDLEQLSDPRQLKRWLLHLQHAWAAEQAARDPLADWFR